jgi:hypothetical protein
MSRSAGRCREQEAKEERALQFQTDFIRGLVVFVVFIALLAADAVLFPPVRATLPFLLYTLIVSAAFCAVCYTKGEPPRWRWGDE